MAKNADKQRVNKEIIQIVKRYVAAVSKDFVVDGAYLFGSFAKGTQNRESDIDVAIILKDFDNRILTNGKLYNYSWGIDTRIEPHSIKSDEYINNQGLLSREIKKYGIKIV